MTENSPTLDADATVAGAAPDDQKTDQKIEKETDRDIDADINRGVLTDLLGYHMRRADAYTFQSFGAALKDDGVSPGQLGVMLLVQATPGINQTRAGRALGVDRSTLVSIIDALEGRGLVKRTPSPTDRRSHALILTDKGAAFLIEIRPRLDAHEQEVARNLSRSERETLITLLQKIVRP